MIIIHHNDADGRLAAHIAGKAAKPGERMVYFEADYAKAKQPEWMGAVEGKIFDGDNDDVVIVDFSFDPGTMVRLDNSLRDRGRSLIWIDHHASCKDHPNHLSGLRNFTNKGPAGCELAWQYFFTILREPRLVTLVGDYDAWRLALAPECKRLILYLDAMQPKPGGNVFELLMSDDAAINRAIELGKAMEKYRDGYCEGMCQAFGFETEFRGLKCFALNIQRTGSMAFGDRMDKYDACLAFIHDGRTWTVSMYSTKPEVDCSAICKMHGGGGHKGASGFQCETLPFKR